MIESIFLIVFIGLNFNGSLLLQASENAYIFMRHESMLTVGTDNDRITFSAT